MTDEEVTYTPAFFGAAGNLSCCDICGALVVPYPPAIDYHTEFHENLKAAMNLLLDDLRKIAMYLGMPGLQSMEDVDGDS